MGPPGFSHQYWFLGTAPYQYRYPICYRLFTNNNTGCFTMNDNKVFLIILAKKQHQKRTHWIFSTEGDKGSSIKFCLLRHTGSFNVIYPLLNNYTCLFSPIMPEKYDMLDFLKRDQNGEIGSKWLTTRFFALKMAKRSKWMKLL